MPRVTEAMRDWVRLWDWAFQADRVAFEEVFSDPRAYHFVRTAFDLYLAKFKSRSLPPGTQAYVDEWGIADVGDAFDNHLTQFGRFAISLATIIGESIQVPAFPLLLPDVLPGTIWTFDGEASLSASGIASDGHLQLRVDGEPMSLPLPELSVDYGRFSINVTAEVGSIRLCPPTFNLPGLQDIRSVVPAPVNEQSSFQEVLTASLDLIEAHAPSTHRQITRYMRTIAFKPAGFGGVFNTSCSRLPGASIFSGVRQRAVLADDLIHEFHHNRFFALEESGGFFKDAAPGTVVRTFYSPWRDDPRPVFGLFHAAYVFERVLAFWVAAMRSRSLRGIESDYAMFRSAKLCAQLEITLAQLNRWADFNERGREIHDLICRAVKEHRERCDQLAADLATPSMVVDEAGHLAKKLDNRGQSVSVGEMLCEHVDTYDSESRCRQLMLEEGEQTPWFTAAVARIVDISADHSPRSARSAAHESPTGNSTSGP